jgi:hypothetical protein
MNLLEHSFVPPVRCHRAKSIWGSSNSAQLFRTVRRIARPQLGGQTIAFTIE